MTLTLAAADVLSSQNAFCFHFFYKNTPSPSHVNGTRDRHETSKLKAWLPGPSAPYQCLSQALSYIFDLEWLAIRARSRDRDQDRERGRSRERSRETERVCARERKRESVWVKVSVCVFCVPNKVYVQRMWAILQYPNCLQYAARVNHSRCPRDCSMVGVVCRLTHSVSPGDYNMVGV